MVVRQHKIKYCRHIVFHQLVGGGGERGRGEIIPANAQPRTQGLISAPARTRFLFTSQLLDYQEEQNPRKKREFFLVKLQVNNEQSIIMIFMIRIKL